MVRKSVGLKELAGAEILTTHFTLILYTPILFINSFHMSLVISFPCKSEITKTALKIVFHIITNFMINLMPC